MLLDGNSRGMYRRIERVVDTDPIRKNDSQVNDRHLVVRVASFTFYGRIIISDESVVIEWTEMLRRCRQQDQHGERRKEIR